MAWLSGWGFRKSITLSRASGAVTNYQMKLLLGESSGATGEDVDCGGLCLSSFNDIRFTTSDGTTLLDYWIESLSGATPNQLATIWIEFDSIGTGATTFYMYYGKSDAAAASSGANTFIVFDNFERGVNGDAVGGAWTTWAGAGTISTAQKFSGTRSFSLGTFNGKIGAAISAEKALRLRFYKPNASFSWMQQANNTTGGYGYRVWIDASENLMYGPGAGTDTGANCTADAWQLLEIQNLNYTANTYDIYLNGSLAQSAAAMQTADVNPVGVQIGGGTGAYYVDDVIIRNFRATGPAWGAWGEAETSIIEDSFAETVTITDAADGYALKESISETATITDVMNGSDLKGPIAEMTTITDTMGRSYEVGRGVPGDTATFSEIIDSVLLAIDTAESATIDDRMFGELGNAIRRKAMFWNIQNEHIQIKFSHSQLGKCVQAEDVAIRSALIRRQDSIRWVHQGRHLSLKFQHFELGETILLEMLSAQINRVSNLYTVNWQDTGMFCHQGNHLAIKIQHHVKGEPMLLESHNLRVNQINNP